MGSYPDTRVDFSQLYARARVMGSYPEIVAKPNICVTEMPSNAVAVLLRSGRDQPSSWTRWTFRRETQHLGRNLRFKGSPVCDRPRSNSCRQPMPFTTGSFRACASGSRTANNGVHQLSLRVRK